MVAPDQRGYNLSDKPKPVLDYAVDRLANDVAELVSFFGHESAHIVGHDWGGNVAWFTAMIHPEVVDRLAILNMPHPVRMREGLKTFRQLLKSWYIGLFQLPWLPEAYFSGFDFAQLRRLFQNDPANPEAFTSADIERYVEAFRHPGAVRSAINYYRASARHDEGRFNAEIDLPTLVLWGIHDSFLGEELAEPPERWVKNCRVERLDASHWVQHDVPERVNSLLLHFLAGS